MIKKVSSAFQLRWQIPDESFDSGCATKFVDYNEPQASCIATSSLAAVRTEGTIGLIGL